MLLLGLETGHPLEFSEQDNLLRAEGKAMKKATGLKYLIPAMLAFAGLGMEVVLAFFLEPLLYQAPMQSWTDLQNILHWIITCAVWGLLSWGIVRFARKQYGFNLFERKNKPAAWQWAVVAVLVIASLVWSCLDWNGMKVVREFNANGLLKFVFQYFYYCFEVALVLLIIVFGQESFEKFFHNRCIPYGGLLAAATWGIAHFITKGSSTGIGTMISALAFGCVYLLVNRDIRKAYPIIWIMFVL